MAFRATAPATLLVAWRPRSTAQRQGEPAWHRRRRRARGEARALLRVAAAANLLQRHHSAQNQMPSVLGGKKGQKGKGSTGGGGGGNGGKGGGLSTDSRTQPGDWACLLCGVQANRDWRERCRNCQAYRNVEMEAIYNDHAKKRMQQQRRNVQQQQQRQQQQQAQEKKNDDDRRQLRQQVERLQAELAASKAQQMQIDEDEGEEEEDDADGNTKYSSWTEEERTKRVDLARGGLAYAIAAHGEESDQAQRFRDEISSIQRASREAKPFKAHRNQLERRKEDLRKKQERDEAAIAAAQAEIGELQEKVKTLQATVDDRAKQLRQVSEELNVIVRKALEEERGEGSQQNGTDTGTQAGAPWATLATAVSGLAGHPGVPKEVAALLAQLQQVASAFTVETTATRARPGSTDPTTTGTAAAADDVPNGTKPKPATPTTPIVLAPHGRFGKAAAAARGPQAPPSNSQPTTPPAGTDSNSGGTGINGGTGTGASYAAVAAGATQAGAGKPGEERNRNSTESEAELVEEITEDGGTAAMEVEESIAKLPDQDQRRIRAAIRGGAARSQRKGGDEEDTETEGGGRRERERSPRPTKHGDKDL